MNSEFVDIYESDFGALQYDSDEDMTLLTEDDIRYQLWLAWHDTAELEPVTRPEER